MKKLAIGLMSGTSLDGIDVVIAYIDGTFKETMIDIVSFDTFPYSIPLKNKIIQSMNPTEFSTPLICSLNFELAHAYADTVFLACKQHNIKIDNIDFIASHGQTVYHISENQGHLIKSTLQLGDGSVLASLTHTTVVSNFRSADIAFLGQGAPLVPYADYILFSNNEVSRSMHNIGGISNLTILPKKADLDQVIAFDTGPGNMMIDYASKVLFGVDFDAFGEIAKSGKVNMTLFEELMSHPFLKKLPPKSTGREEFGKTYADLILKKYKSGSKEDLLCTLTHFTAKSIADSYRNFVFLKHKVDEIYLSGGGAKNCFLVDLIQQYLPTTNVLTLDKLGIDVSCKEALSFLILANETLHLKPSNVPSATGSTCRAILGQVSYVHKSK